MQRRRINSTDYRLGYKLFVNNSWDHDGWAAYLVSLQNTIKIIICKRWQYETIQILKNAQHLWFLNLKKCFYYVLGKTNYLFLGKEISRNSKYSLLQKTLPNEMLSSYLVMLSYKIKIQSCMGGGWPGAPWQVRRTHP